MAGRTMICHHCKAQIILDESISRTAECPECSADIHCCLNCENYDPAAHNRCREPQAEWVSDREKANFCDLFNPNKRKSQSGMLNSKEIAKKAFDDLFKK
jgi:hypothetical protein